MEEQIQFPNHLDETLSATFHQPDGPIKGAVVAGHCFTCSRHTGVLRRICQQLANQGFLTLRFDFSGNGQSQGSFTSSTWSKQMVEMEAAIELVKARGADWVSLVGHSLGAAISLLVASQRPDIQALCRVAGRVGGDRPMHFLTGSQQDILNRTGEVVFTSRGRQLTLDRAFFDDAGRYDLLEATRSLDRPMLVVHGDRDDIIPVSEAYLAKETNPERVELMIVPEGDHMLARADHQQQVATAVADWFTAQAEAAWQAAR